MPRQSEVVAITGAASGLGLALAKHYLARGASVACADRDRPRLEKAVRELSVDPMRILIRELDVRDASSLSAFAVDCDRQFGSIGIFFNNAGVAGAGSLAETSLDDWHWMLDINLMGVVRGCKAVVPLMKQQGYGHVVNIASLAGIASAPMMASYNVAKAAVISLSESLRADLAGTGVGVSVVCPSFFTSDLASSARTSNAEQQRIVSKLVNKARYSADDIARIVADEVAAGRFMILPQRDARFAWWYKRMLPEHFHRWVVKQSRGMVASENAAKEQGMGVRHG